MKSALAACTRHGDNGGEGRRCQCSLRCTPELGTPFWPSLNISAGSIQRRFSA